MNISITKPALNWYKREIDLKEGDHLRFFARYGGCGDVQNGFSLGISKTEPRDAAAQVEVEGILFFVEKEDLWYFDEHNFSVKYSRKYDEIEYVFEK